VGWLKPRSSWRRCGSWRTCAAGAEGVCLAGAQPGLDVVDDDPEPRAAGGVGAGAVVEAAGEQQDRSGGHFRRYGLSRVGLVQAACHGEGGPGPLSPGAVEAGSPLGDVQQRAEFRPGRGQGLLAQQPVGAEDVRPVGGMAYVGQQC
jgi:hypothetical protein